MGIEMGLATEAMKDAERTSRRQRAVLLFVAASTPDDAAKAISDDNVVRLGSEWNFYANFLSIYTFLSFSNYFHGSSFREVSSWTILSHFLEFLWNFLFPLKICFAEKDWRQLAEYSMPSFIDSSGFYGLLIMFIFNIYFVSYD